MASQQKNRLLHSGVCQPELISQIFSNLQSLTSAGGLTSLRRIFGMVFSVFFAWYYMGSFVSYDGPRVDFAVLVFCRAGGVDNPVGLVNWYLIYIVYYIPSCYQVLYHLVKYILYRGQPGSYPSSSQSSLVCLEYSNPPRIGYISCRAGWLGGLGYL